MTRELIASCLECLDQASRWLDRMDASGEVPSNADAEANRIIERISHGAQQQPRAPVSSPVASTAWIDAVLQSHPQIAGKAKTALRFAPRSASFFQGVDPLAVVASLPNLLWLDAQPIDRWPTLDELDPFESILVITALSGSSVDEVSACLQDHIDESTIVAINSQQPAGATDLPANARKLIEAQSVLLSNVSGPTLVGRMASAGRVVANVLHHCGQTSNADLIVRATDACLLSKNPEALVRQIAAVVAPAQVQAAVGVAPAQAETAMGRTLKINAERVDALVRLTGELLVVKNAIGHAASLAQGTDHALNLVKEHHGVLDHLLGELQRAVLAIRVLPLRTVMQRFPRTVRELSASLQKPVKLTIEGEDTEADKAIVEALFEPLMHIVRNALDHGIEDSALRVQRNKPAVATIRMRASRQGPNVLIEVEDDGGGIDAERIRTVLRERNVIDATSLAAMPDHEVIDLVFAPGFSTASSVTELSGRGVGLDAVRTAVERMGGHVGIESRVGAGTVVRLTLPFSVMMTHVMTVEAGGQMFGIPLDAVVETVRVPTIRSPESAREGDRASRSDDSGV